MELIPAISNFLDISTDVLFETDKKAERLRNLSSEAWKIHGWDYNSCRRRIDIYRNILKEFPNDYDTMNLLITDLSHDNDNTLKHREEITELCNRIINDSPDITMRKSATYSLARQYKDMGYQEKAVKIIKESSIIHPLQNGIHFSREYLMSFVAEDEEAALNLKIMLQILCNELCSGIWNNLICTESQAYIQNDGLSNEEWLEVLKRHIVILQKINKFMEIFYEDGDYSNHDCILYSYLVLAENHMIFGEYDKTLDNIEKCAEIAIIFDTKKPGAHTSILSKDIKIYGSYPFCNYGNHPENIKYNQSYRLIHDWFLSKKTEVLVPVGDKNKRERKSYYEFYAPIRETERFKTVIANLEKYAKIERE